MKVNTFLKYNFLADLYVPRVDPKSDQIIYYGSAENQDIQVGIVTARQSMTMFTRVSMEFGSRIENLRNPRGVKLLVTPTGTEMKDYPMHVHACDPVVDVYGNVTGYRSVLRKPQPALTDVQELEEGEGTDPNQGPGN